MLDRVRARGWALVAIASGALLLSACGRHADGDANATPPDPANSAAASGQSGSNAMGNGPV